MRLRNFPVLLWLLLGTASVQAQRTPELGYVFPPGGRAGATVEVRLGGYDWTPDLEYFVHDPRVRLEILGPPGELLLPGPPYWFGSKSFLQNFPLPREVAARITLPADMPPGPVYWQVANANGASLTGIFLVGAGAELIEDEERQAPQRLSELPIRVLGRLGRLEEVDRYRFSVERSGPIACRVTARRLGADWNAVLEVRDAAGALVADAADTEGRDLALCFAAQAGTEYTLSLMEIDFRGHRSFVYQLEITPAGLAVAAFPAAARRGETRELEFVGWGLASGDARLETVRRRVEFPSDRATSAWDYRLETPFGLAPPLRLLVSDLAETVAAAPAGPAADPMPIRLAAPGAVTAVLGDRHGRARYQVACRQGERWRASAMAREIGSPLDVALAVFGPDRAKLAENDNLPGTVDAALEFDAPADGDYELLVTDSSGHTGTPTAVYRLAVERARDDFRLETAVDRLQVPLGGTAELVVTAQRFGRLRGPIRVSIAGLPPGITAPADATIAAEQSEIKIPLAAAAEAPSGAALATIAGTAELADGLLTRAAHARSAANLAPRTDDDNRLPSILVAATMRPRTKIAPVEQDERTVHRGTTHLAEVIVDRLEGFTGPVTLKMGAHQPKKFRQGFTGPDLVVGEGVSRIMYPCFLPQWLETVDTYRMSLIAEAVVSDPGGKLRYLVSEMDPVLNIGISIEGALLKLSPREREFTLRPGEPLDVRLKISRSATLTAPIELTLDVPRRLAGMVQAAPQTIAADRSEAVFVLERARPPRVTGPQPLTIRATTVDRQGLPVMAETTVTVEFVAER